MHVDNSFEIKYGPTVRIIAKLLTKQSKAINNLGVIK